MDKQLGKYLLKAQLGTGGMGVVYLAVDVRLQREVALKILPRQVAANLQAVERFFHEARALARLNHPHVVSIYDSDQDRGYCYLAMELLNGGTMQEALKNGPLPWNAATDIIAQACRGVAAAHDLGLIHRDIKPSNLMRNVEGCVKVTDFGLAKIADDASGATPLTKPGAILGTPQYMSPEQCQGEPLDVRSDVYSLGATYFALLVGQPPFIDAQPLQVMFAHCSKPTPDPRALRDDIPPACAQIVLKAMAKSRADRYSTAQEMLTALQQLGAAPPREEPGRMAPLSNSWAAEPTMALNAEAFADSPAQPRRMALPRWAVGRRGTAAAFTGSLLVVLLVIGLAALSRGPDRHTVEGKPPDARPIRLQEAGELPVGGVPIRSVAFAADSASLFAGASDGSVRQWDLEQRQATRTFAGSRQTIRAVAANQRWLAAGGDAKTLWLWKLDADRAPEAWTDFAGEISAVAISANGQRLAVGTYAEVRLYELSDNGARLLRVLGTSNTRPMCYMVMAVAFSADSRWLAATTWNGKRVFVWDALSGVFRSETPALADEPMAVAFLPGRDRLLLGLHHRGLVQADIDRPIIEPWRDQDSVDVRAFALTPDGRTAIVVGEWGGAVRCYDLQRDAPPRILRRNTGASALTAAISADARRLATGGGDADTGRGYLHLWNVVRE